LLRNNSLHLKNKASVTANFTGAFYL